MLIYVCWSLQLSAAKVLLFFELCKFICLMGAFFHEQRKGGVWQTPETAKNIWRDNILRNGRKRRLYHSRTTDEIRAANQICRERKKKPACSVVEQAGVNVARRTNAESRTERASYRVIERAKGGPENPEILDRYANPGRLPKLERKVLFNLLTLQRVNLLPAEDEDLTVTKHLCTPYLVTWYFVNTLCIAGSGERDSLCIKCPPIIIL